VAVLLSDPTRHGRNGQTFLATT